MCRICCNLRATVRPHKLTTIRATKVDHASVPGAPSLRVVANRWGPRTQSLPDIADASGPTPDAYFVWNCPSRLLASVPVPNPWPVSTLK